MILIESSEAPDKTLVVIPTFEGAKVQHVITPAETHDECWFERFPELPLELRQQIYEESRPEPRILRFGFEEVMVDTTVEELRKKGEDVIHKVQNHHKKCKTSGLYGLQRLKGAFEKISRRGRLVWKAGSSKPSDNATSLPWALLAVNKETREWARKRYHLAFEGELLGIGGIHIDFTQDTLLFGNNKAFQAMFAALQHRNTCRVENNGDLSWPIHNSPDGMDKVSEHMRYLAIQDEVAASMTPILAKFPSLSKVHFHISSDLLIWVLNISSWQINRNVEIIEQKIREINRTMDRFDGYRYNQVYGQGKNGDGSEARYLDFPEVKALTLGQFQDEFHR